MDKNIDAFFLFVRCRHMIWHRRFVEKLPPPWTDDPILAKYKFTNVYRELDAGTQFLWGSVPHGGADSLLFPIVFYRFINRPDYFIWTGDTGGVVNIESDIDVGILCETLREYVEETGKPLFNTAYRVICNTPRGDSRIDELERLLLDFQKNHDRLVKEIEECKTFEELNTILQQIKHVGPFLAYEIACDLINLDRGLKRKFSENDWANIGPGAFVGLANIFPKQKKALAKEPQALGLELARELQELQEEYLPVRFPYYDGKLLSLRNIEHSLCEYGKYCNILNGKGRARPLFTPSQNSL